MEADDAIEAGPSSPKPVFRKKKNKSRAAGEPISARPIETSRDDAGPGSEDYEDEEEVSVADLIALRSLNRKPTGIELEKLNKGIKKKKQKKKGPTEEDRWKEQMEKGGLVKPGEMSGRMGGGSTSAPARPDSDSEEEDPTSRAKRRVRQDNFQGETNVIDVDKHMMAYIESEMLKRRAANKEDSTAAVSQSDITSVLSNPEDELYKVAEKYTRLQAEARNAATANRLIANKSRPDDEEGEGNVGLSSAMLSGIPEVELGMDSRLKNIEETEKAKQALYEQRLQQRRDRGGDREADELLANARFFNPRNKLQSDAQAIAEARKRAQEEEERKNGGGGGSDTKQATHNRQSHKREMATDDQVMQRFKKRQLNNMKR